MYSGMTDSAALLRSIKAHLDVMDSIIADMKAMVERRPNNSCPRCHDCHLMVSESGAIVPCACREAGLDEQRAARGE